MATRLQGQGFLLEGLGGAQDSVFFLGTPARDTELRMGTPLTTRMWELPKVSPRLSIASRQAAFAALKNSPTSAVVPVVNMFILFSQAW